MTPCWQAATRIAAFVRSAIEALLVLEERLRRESV
jgi:hypothetical protein